MRPGFQVGQSLLALQAALGDRCSDPGTQRAASSPHRHWSRLLPAL